MLLANLLSRLGLRKRRSEGVITDPQDWRFGWKLGQQTAAGVNVTPEASLRLVAVMACVSLLAEVGGSLPIGVYRRRTDGGRELAGDHYLQPVLRRRPNRRHSSATFRELIISHMLLRGDFYAQKIRDARGRVVELWPLNPTRMTVSIAPDGSLAYRYESLSYGVVDLSAYDVLHIPSFGYNGVTGLSRIELARTTVGAGLAADEYSARFWANDATPRLALKMPLNKTLTAEAKQRLKEGWFDEHRGTANAHSVAILEDGTDIQEVGMKLHDAQFLETRGFTVEEIARLFRIPPHLIQHQTKSTSWGTGMEQLGIGFVVYTLGPWLRRIEESLELQLLQDWEIQQANLYIRHNTSALLRGDVKTRHETYAMGRQWGYLSANDIRRLEDMNPVDGGDTYLVPLNMVPASEAGAALRALHVREAGRLVDDLAAERLHHGRQSRAAGGGLTRRRIQRAFRRPLRDAAARIIRRERNDVLTAARKILKGRSVTELQDWLEDFYRNQHPEFVVSQIEPALRGLAEAIGSQVADELGTDWELTPELEEWIADSLAGYATAHTASSRYQLLDVIRRAQEDDSDVLEALKERFREWEEGLDGGTPRPDKIADSKTKSWGNGFARRALMVYGVTHLVSRAYGDSCPYCTDLDGTVVGIEEPFLRGGEAYQPEGADAPLTPSADIYAPPYHGGCDCVVEAAT